MHIPTISILMPVHNTSSAFFIEAVESVLSQSAGNWELCIANSIDSHGAFDLRSLCDFYAARDPRIKVRHMPNAGISGNTNAALEMATGEYIGLLDSDDLLASHAVESVSLLLQAKPWTDFVYSDEDKVDELGRHFDPYYKPDWSPDTLMSKNYTCHFGVYRTSILRKIRGFRPEYDGAQDYDMVLRFTEKAQNIEHIADVLYHWRSHPASTASGADAKPYAQIAAKKALEDALQRRKEPGTVEPVHGWHNVRYTVKKPKKVTIILPFKDGHQMTDNLLTSIFQKTDYPNFDVLLVDNQSTDPLTQHMVARWQAREPKRVRYIQYDKPFNYSDMNNFAASRTDAEYLLFLNNDTLVLTDSWVTDMVGYAQRERTGVVGVKLLYPDRTIQHAGVVTGIGGAAGHVFLHAPEDHPGYFGRAATVTNYSAVTAACIMVRSSVFKFVGGFNNALKVAFNDVDFCLKVQGSGYHNVYLPFVKLIHFESKTRGYEDTPEKKARFDAEVAMLQSLWPNLRNDPCYNPNLSLHNTYNPDWGRMRANSFRRMNLQTFDPWRVDHPYNQQFGPATLEARF